MVRQSEPIIIQGGMGVAVSSWPLARAVSQLGQLGVVSGTALDVVLARRLQLGDQDGSLRRALAAFPFPEMVDRVLNRYFIDGGKLAQEAFAYSPMPSAVLSRQHLELIVIGNFVEVYLAKENHSGLVGINYLEKIQPPTLPSLFGAMLADVDYILMGAGIPRRIPGIIDQLCRGESVELPLNVDGLDSGESVNLRFDPTEFCTNRVPHLRRPKFLAIVASATLASMLAKKSSGHVDGFVVEGPRAGGHNAPPRGAVQLNERGEPVYGERDVVDLQAMKAIGLPFWLAGSYGTPERLVEAIEQGAAGVQVGTAFALCDESGILPEIRQQILEMSRAGTVDVVTDRLASPTGFPFKVVQLPGSLSDESVCENRRHNCDLGFLRQAYAPAPGELGWRCPADRVENYLARGGRVEDTYGRKCVCNGLLATVGLGQVRDGEEEPPLVTCGDEVRHLADTLLSPSKSNYSAKDVVDYLLSRVGEQLAAV